MRGRSIHTRRGDEDTGVFRAANVCTSSRVHIQLYSVYGLIVYYGATCLIRHPVVLYGQYGGPEGAALTPRPGLEGELELQRGGANEGGASESGSPTELGFRRAEGGSQHLGAGERASGGAGDAYSLLMP